MKIGEFVRVKRVTISVKINTLSAKVSQLNCMTFVRMQGFKQGLHACNSIRISLLYICQVSRRNKISNVHS